MPFNSPSEETSGEVQDVMSAVPHAIVRWGITVVVAVVAVLLWMGWMVQYPDVLTSRISVTSQKPPASVVAPISGKLARLCVTEGQSVTNGTVLAVIESAADSDAVFKLQGEMEQLSVQLSEADGVPAFHFDHAARLGEIQPAYSEFLAGYRQYHSLLLETNYEQKIALLGRQITQTRELADRVALQHTILLREQKLAEGKFDQERRLGADRIVSPASVAEAEAASLSKQRESVAADNTLIHTGIQIIEYEKTINDLRQQRDEQRRQLRIALHESFKKLRTQVAIWTLQHVLKAPVDGAVSFFKFWTQHQHVQAQEEVMTIVPATGQLLGRIILKEGGAGKIRHGQLVRVKLDDFPSHEYGTVSATVDSLSLVPRGNTYVVSLRFDAGLKTSYGRTLSCKQEMQGAADIVTARRRLIGRIFNEIRNLVAQPAS